MSSTKLYFARRPFQYGPDVERDFLDLDQVTRLRGEINDEAMLRIGYLAPVEGQSIVACGHCGRRFVSDRALSNHGLRRHSKVSDGVIKEGRPMSEGELAQRIEAGMIQPFDPRTHDLSQTEEHKAKQEEDRLNADRPIFFDRTKASIDSGDTKPPEINTKTEKVAKKRGRPRKAQAAEK